MFDFNLEVNDQALEQLRPHTENFTTEYDVLLMTPFVASEGAYYLASRLNASLVLYVSGQDFLSVTVSGMVTSSLHPFPLLPMSVIENDSYKGLWDRMGHFFKCILIKLIRFVEFDQC